MVLGGLQLWVPDRVHVGGEEFRALFNRASSDAGPWVPVAGERLLTVAAVGLDPPQIRLRTMDAPSAEYATDPTEPHSTKELQQEMAGLLPRQSSSQASAAMTPTRAQRPHHRGSSRRRRHNPASMWRAFLAAPPSEVWRQGLRIRTTWRDGDAATCLRIGRSATSAGDTSGEFLQGPHRAEPVTVTGQNS